MESEMVFRWRAWVLWHEFWAPAELLLGQSGIPQFLDLCWQQQNGKQQQTSPHMLIIPPSPFQSLRPLHVVVCLVLWCGPCDGQAPTDEWVCWIPSLCWRSSPVWLTWLWTRPVAVDMDKAQGCCFLVGSSECSWAGVDLPSCNTFGTTLFPQHNWWMQCEDVWPWSPQHSRSDSHVIVWLLGGSHWGRTGKPLLLVDPNCVFTAQLPGSDTQWMPICRGRTAKPQRWLCPSVAHQQESC